MEQGQERPNAIRSADEVLRILILLDEATPKLAGLLGNVARRFDSLLDLRDDLLGLHADLAEAEEERHDACGVSESENA